MDRVAEPELMDDQAQARAYAQADFEPANRAFCNLLEERAIPISAQARVIDLGCGPADIVLRLARAHPGWVLEALDAAAAMLDQARAAVARCGLAGRISLILDRLPTTELPAHAYDLVTSNSLVHHLPNPMILWESLVRLGKPGAWAVVMDLRRPESSQAARDLVELYSPNEPEILKNDFYHSLLAAYRVEEIREQLRQAGLTSFEVESVSDRHWLVWGRIS